MEWKEKNDYLAALPFEKRDSLLQLRSQLSPGFQKSDFAVECHTLLSPVLLVCYVAMKIPHGWHLVCVPQTATSKKLPLVLFCSLNLDRGRAMYKLYLRS